MSGDGLLCSLTTSPWYTYLGVSLGDFAVKQNRTCACAENLFLTGNRFSTNEMFCSVVNYNHKCHISEKDIQIWTFLMKQLIDKISFFSGNTTDFTRPYL